MDALLAAAISEICSAGASGITLTSLWSKLQQKPLSHTIKSSLWTQLLSVPSIQLETATWRSRSSSEEGIRRYEEAERMNLRIAANQHIRDCFSGLYDVSSASLPPHQRLALQHVAASGTNGITQNQLAKEIGKEGNYAFYVVKSLESKQLIVRQPVIVKTKEVEGNGEIQNNLSISTNLIYLPRYAKHLGAQQRFEISKEEQTSGSVGDADVTDTGGDGCAGESVIEDVRVRDYLPAMKAICEKLEEADDKVLIVSDIKKDLGYSGIQGHRAWRNMCNRLKDAGFVEDFDAKVNEKVVRCLRLLKRFFPMNSSAKDLRFSDHNENEELLKFGRRCQKTDQLVELPVDHQVYDMIDAEGAVGALVLEVCEKLGLDRKKNDSRFRNLCTRFGMHVQAENHKKTAAYRVWTPTNCNSETSTPLDLSKVATGETKCNSYLDNLDVPGKTSGTFPEYDTPAKVDVTTSENKVAGDNCNDLTENGNCSQKAPGSGAMLEFPGETSCAASNVESELASVCPHKIISLNLLKSRNCALSETSPSPPLTVDTALREHRILERLQGEKFILRFEVQNWLASLEKDKGTKIDRRTVERILLRLEQKGLCKLQDVHVPTVTNCDRYHKMLVVLHPSAKDSLSELLGEIHDRFRSLEKQSRKQGSARPKDDEPVPVLSGMMRRRFHVGSDDAAMKTEAMRANGFVPVKIVRAKLLHIFLWGYISSLPGWDNCLLPGSHARTYKLFDLKVALEAIPLKLFLQVVGSTQKFDDMSEKCKLGLCLSDLPVEEYKCLRDSQATARLSVVIDILRRLKLIRIIRDDRSVDGSNIPRETFAQAIDLKPYIEEPLSTIAISNLRSVDLRPRIRHDFTLSNKEAVEEYWKTLENCYGTADRLAASQAFPGSAVPEVLRFHHINHWERLKRFRSAVNCNKRQPPRSKQTSSSKKRKNSVTKSSQCVAQFKVNELLCDDGFNKLPETGEQLMEDKDFYSSGEEDEHQEDDNLEIAVGQDLGRNEEESCYSLISRCAFSRFNPTRTRFSWTDEADRQLVFQYVRRRAVLGEKVVRVDWTGLSGLPASPKICQRRMAYLNRDSAFRKALIKLCMLLSERYLKHQERIQNVALNHNKSPGVLSREPPDGFRHAEEGESEIEQWDDFNEKTIKSALEDVLRYKQMAKLENCKRVGSAPEEWSNLDRNIEDTVESALVGSSTVNENSKVQRNHQNFTRRSGRQHLHDKLIQRLNGWKNISMQVQESLAVCNAVEILKLVYLSVSPSPEWRNVLAETLRRYSECDVFAAFSYLREKKILVGDDGGPFVLSHPFLHNVSKSPFPAETGKRAAEFLDWLHEREEDLMEEGFALNSDLQCGDIFQLFALVSSGELSISPSLPEEGVGEAEDFKSLKRKPDDDEFSDTDKTKRLKSLADGELFTRREKGFPGIMVSVSRKTISTASIIESYIAGKTFIGEDGRNSKRNPALSQKISCSSSHLDHKHEIPDFSSIEPTTRWSCESPWEAMAHYSTYLLSRCSIVEQVGLFDSKVFMTLYCAIQNAGDQGLTMEEICSTVGLSENACEHFIDVLQAFGRVLKVNACDSVHIVDALYQSKYFLTPSSSLSQNSSPHPTAKLVETSNAVRSVTEHKNQNPVSTSSQSNVAMKDSDVHKVTVLNLPETRSSNTSENQQLDEATLAAHNTENATNKLSFSESCIPILPWVNIDGTINKPIYKGLVRRVLGIVMHNPGILEDDIVRRIDVLTPQSCRSLLDLLILDKHLRVRQMHQSTFCGPPTLLRSLVGNSFKEPKSVYRRHIFANPMSASLL